MHQQEYALRYLEAVIRYVASAGRNVSAEDVRAAIEAVAPEGDDMIGTIAQEWLQQGLQQGIHPCRGNGCRGQPCIDGCCRSWRSWWGRMVEERR